VLIGNLGTIGANIDARLAVVETGTLSTLRGSLYAKEVKSVGWATFTYDSAIIDVPGCAPPAKECSDCHDCSGSTLACRSGTCGPCQTSSDCCAPFDCRAGACVPPDEIR
jgi:hypothetical protein